MFENSFSFQPIRKSSLKKYQTWTILSLPALISIAWGLRTGVWVDFWHEQLSWTGFASASFFVITMLITPLKALNIKHSWLTKIQRNRRALGVATFIYALGHVVAFFMYKTVKDGAIPWGLLFHPVILSGVIAFLIFFVLALTSNNYSIKTLGWKTWKKLHQWAHKAQWLLLFHLFFTGLKDTTLANVTSILMLTVLLFLQQVRKRQPSCIESQTA
jgi:sulfoxide reductase heme-binding subunit YedZ